MKVAVVILAIIGLISASPLAQKAKPSKGLRANEPASLPSGSSLSMECAPTGYTLRYIPADGVTVEEAAVGIGAGNDLSDVTTLIPSNCQQLGTAADGGFDFAQRNFVECGGDMLPNAEGNAEYTVAVSLAEAVPDTVLPVSYTNVYTVDVKCSFLLTPPEGANGEANPETVDRPAVGESNLGFSLTPSIRAANLYAFTLAPEATAAFPAGINFNIVSCSSVPNVANPTEEYVFYDANRATPCGTRVAVEPGTDDGTGARTFTVVVPSHRFKGTQPGNFLNAVSVECSVRLCNEADATTCAPRNCDVPAPVIPDPVDPVDPVEPVEPVVPRTRLQVPKAVAQYKAKPAPLAKSGKVILVK